MPTGRPASSHFNRRKATKQSKGALAPRVRLHSYERQVVLTLGNIGEITRALELLNAARKAAGGLYHEFDINSSNQLIERLRSIAGAPAVPEQVAA